MRYGLLHHPSVQDRYKDHHLAHNDRHRWHRGPSGRVPRSTLCASIGRIGAIPPDAWTLLQRVQLPAARSVGSEVIQLRDTARQLELDANLSTK